MDLFVGKPELILAVSGIFFFAYFLIRLLGRKLPSMLAWPLLMPAIAWTLFAVWEMYCTLQQYNIRVDLFLIYPFLIVVTFLGFIVSIAGMILSLFKQCTKA